MRCARLGAFVGLGILACACGEHSWDTEEFSRTQLNGLTLPRGTFALTFDDGPGPRTAELGSYLAEQGIPATFFVQGSRAVNKTSVLAALSRQGHLIANHSWSHASFTDIADPVDEVSRTDRVIAPYVPRGVFLFRAPYGNWAPHVADVLNATELRRYVGGIFWDIGGSLTASYAADWACWSRGLSVEECGNRYFTEISNRGRGIVLMHDIHGKTIDMVKQLVPRLKAQGHRFVRADGIPLIADRIRDAGGHPSSQPLPQPTVQPTPERPHPALGALACPAGFQLEPVGRFGGVICATDSQAYGAFTAEMIRACIAKGGGRSCQSTTWARSLALAVRGTGLCPAGSAYDAGIRYCVEGDMALGPFPSSIVASCQRHGGDCDPLRIPRSVLARMAGS